MLSLLQDVCMQRRIQHHYWMNHWEGLMQLNFLTVISGNITFCLWHLALLSIRAVRCQAYLINPGSEYMWEELSCAAQLLSQPDTAAWDGSSSPSLPLLCQRDGHWAFVSGSSWFAGHASGRISVISVSSSGRDLVAAAGSVEVHHNWKVHA